MLKRLIISSLLAAMFSGIGGIKPAGAPVQGNNDNPFIVGVFRPDGIIVPFARYANRKWSNPWHQAQPDGQPDETDTIADLSTAWYRSLVSPSGEVACPSSIWPSKLSDNVARHTSSRCFAGQLQAGTGGALAGTETLISLADARVVLISSLW